MKQLIEKGFFMDGEHMKKALIVGICVGGLVLAIA